MTGAIADLLVAPTKAGVPTLLNDRIVSLCAAAIASRGVFTIALSGGSLPSFLSTLQASFLTARIDPQFDKWHVLLADERCVESTDPDSNLGALETHLFSNVAVPQSQIYGIDESLLDESTSAVAEHYELVVKQVLQMSGGMLDVAVLGFGPDGHTCSLFPGHELLQEQMKWVAPISDSPKPPLDRITLTYPVLNQYTRHVIFCGAGASKAPILKANFGNIVNYAGRYTATLNSPAPYPCGNVIPQDSLTWIVDADALQGVSVTSQPPIAELLVASTKAQVPQQLNDAIVPMCANAIATRGVFTIALSGGSLPTFLASLPASFKDAGCDPQFDKWHVILADERCVVSTDPDSNLGSLQEKLFGAIGIPASQIYGINEAKLESTLAVAQDYELVVREVLNRSDGILDVAVLGFGPDGHTCSLFPGHELLQEHGVWVAPISDSPKPPLDRITLTLPVLNRQTRNIIFCGAGISKAPILQGIFRDVTQVGSTMTAQMVEPVPYPCGMIVPTATRSSRLLWVVDAEALTGVDIANKQVTAQVLVAPTKADVPSLLNAQIVEACHEAITNRGVFTLALSGGSLPSFLSTCHESFDAMGVDPCYDKWHVLLADERCVAESDPDSNLGALQMHLFSKVPVPKSQIYGIDETKLDESTEAVANAYDIVLRKVLHQSGGLLDVAVLGFGPDGHTCSLFPGHALLQEDSKWVAPITDSPKPPSNRITVTYPVWNNYTRTVIFCGAGDSKQPILQAIFEPVTKVGDSTFEMTMKDPAPYPCGKVVPTALGTSSKLMWVVDQAAMPEFTFAS